MAEKTLAVRGAAWAAVHNELLAPALACDPSVTVATLRDDVAAGRATLLDVIDTETGEHVASVVLRVEARERGAEGVIDAAAGRLDGVRLAREVLPAIEARFKGVRWIRIHTGRTGLVRELVRHHGYDVRETILAKAVE